MAYSRNDDDVQRLAEVIFTERMQATKVPPRKDQLEKLVDAEVFFAFMCAENFARYAEGWSEGEESE